MRTRQSGRQDPIQAHMTTPRIDVRETAGKQYAAMVALDRSIELDPRLRELVKLRASQLNGCAFCIDVHWKDARARGESEGRLYMLAAWREGALYDARERAALALCEAITRVGEDDVSDDVWHSSAKHFGSDELAQLVLDRIDQRAEPGGDRDAPAARKHGRCRCIGLETNGGQR